MAEETLSVVRVSDVHLHRLLPDNVLKFFRTVLEMSSWFSYLIDATVDSQSNLLWIACNQGNSRHYLWNRI